VGAGVKSVPVVGMGWYKLGRSFRGTGGHPVLLASPKGYTKKAFSKA